MEQQILKAINHIKYVSKKGVTISGIQRFLKKKSTTTFDETSLQEIICKMQQNSKIDGKFKIMNPTIYDDKNFPEDPLEIHPKTFHPEESVNTTLINSNNDSYSETDKSFIDEHINSDDQNKTASDSEITINSMEHHLSDSITSAENLNDKSCDCIARLESLKDEFNLKATNIKRNLVLKIENLKDEITSIRKDIEPTFDKNLIETINKHEGENEKLKEKIKLLEAENKILKDDIGTKQKVKKEILNLSSKKATRKGDIPAKILKNSINTYLSELTILINNCLKEGVFPDDLKLADITPIFKKEDSLNKENYRPISILSHLSKVFERILYKQIDSFMKNKFSPYLCGFRKNHNAQYSLLKMIENWKKQLDNGEKVGAIFMDLSKAFDTINHSLLLAN